MLSVSVVVANYNYGKYIAAAIESALAQSIPPLEIIVVDDGSTDESRDVLQRFSDRVKIVLTENRGQPSAFNTGIALAKGDLVCTLDSDDLFARTKLETVIDAFEANRSVQWVYHRLRFVDRSTLVPIGGEPDLTRLRPGKIDIRADMQKGRYRVAFPATSALSWRTEFVQRLLPIPAELIGADNYLKCASALLGEGYLIDGQLADQGIHNSNMYTSSSTERRKQVRLIDAVWVSRRMQMLGSSAYAYCDSLDAAALYLSRWGRDLLPREQQALNTSLRSKNAARLASVSWQLAKMGFRSVLGKAN